MAVTTTQQELVDIIAKMEPDDAAFMLDFIKRFVLKDDLATRDDLKVIQTAREQYRNGEYITLTDYDKTRN